MYKLHSIFYFGLLCLLMFGFPGCKPSPSIDDKDPVLRRVAVSNINDQQQLAKLAMMDADSYIRKTALSKLTDQAMLAKVALDADRISTRINAMEKLADQAQLATVAEQSMDWVVKKAAVKKIPGQENLAMLMDAAGELYCQPALENDLKPIDKNQCIARLRLAFMEPRIKIHFPELQSKVETIKRSQDYYSMYDNKYMATLHKEDITIKVYQGDKTIVKGFWAADMGYLEDFYEPGIEKSKDVDETTLVDCEYLLKKLFHLSVFTQEDLAELAHSIILEVRTAAIYYLSDEVLLAKIAMEDRRREVRRVAAEKLTDQMLLSKLAIENTESSVRLTAIGKLNDQSLLAKLALEGTTIANSKPLIIDESDSRISFRNWNDDRAEQISEIAAEDDRDIRIAAIQSLTDKTFLTKLIVDQRAQVINEAGIRISHEDRNITRAAEDRIDELEGKTTSHAYEIPDGFYASP